MRIDWDTKLKSRGIEPPEDKEEFATIVFSQPDYQDRLDREIEAQAYRTSGFKIE